MISMAMSAEERAESYPVEASAPDAPKYPYGLELQLDDDVMRKLGMADCPDVGYVMRLTALVTVTRCSTSQQQDSDKENSMSLQITDMQLDAPAPDNAAIAARMYPGLA